MEPKKWRTRNEDARREAEGDRMGRGAQAAYAMHDIAGRATPAAARPQRHAQPLEKALRLDVFSVIDKPVNMCILQEQLNRLFLKRYRSNIFS